jgi:hypothetical protein
VGGLIKGGACDRVGNGPLPAGAKLSVAETASAVPDANACVARCTVAGGTKGARIAGMDLQQSVPSWPCGAHGIEVQHCVACCGVVIAPQSSAYAARATTSATITIDLKTSLTNLTYSPRASQSTSVSPD